jgi:hypothetical protein
MTEDEVEVNIADGTTVFALVGRRLWGITCPVWVLRIRISGVCDEHHL